MFRRHAEASCNNYRKGCAAPAPRGPTPPGCSLFICLPDAPRTAYFHRIEEVHPYFDRKAGRHLRRSDRLTGVPSGRVANGRAATIVNKAASIAIRFNTRMHDAVQEKVFRLIADYADTAPDEITMETTFEELGLDSVDGLSIMSDLEDEFDVSLPSDEVLGMTRIGQAVEAFQTHMNGSGEAR